jgi:hypothetical protein
LLETDAADEIERLGLMLSIPIRFCHREGLLERISSLFRLAQFPAYHPKAIQDIRTHGREVGLWQC